MRVKSRSKKEQMSHLDLISRLSSISPPASADTHSKKRKEGKERKGKKKRKENERQKDKKGKEKETKKII